MEDSRLTSPELLRTVNEVQSESVVEADPSYSCNNTYCNYSNSELFKLFNRLTTEALVNYSLYDLEVIYKREENLPKGPWKVKDKDPYTVVLMSGRKEMCEITSKKADFAYEIANYLNHARLVIPKLCGDMLRKIK